VQNQETGPQIAKLEGKIEALTWMLQSVVKATGVSAVLPPALNESLSTSSIDDAISNTSNIYNDAGGGPTPESEISHHFSLSDIGGPSSPQLYEPTPDEAEGYLEIFRNYMLPCFPFIHISPDLTAHQLCQDRPFLFRAIVATATSSTQQKLIRTEELRHLLIKSAMLENKSSIDMLLGTLTYIAWSTDPFLKRTNNLSRMMMLAISLTYDLQLVKSLAPPEAHVIARMAPGLGESDHDASDASTQDLVEQQRAVLACYVLSSMYVIP
jgi:hypothetical protein